MVDISKIWPEWRVAGLIGEGSFGKVYKCVREEYGMTFESAVKVINIPAGMAEYQSVRTECNSEAELRSFFEDIVSDFSNEIKLMLLLKGASNIVSVDNYKIVEKTDEFGWKIYIFMEYLTSFVTYSKNKEFTEEEVRDFALDMLNALTICTKSNIIHRDIKPANIFVDRFGSYKLGDFGVARQLESSVSMMSKKGTYNYMAPEVFKGSKYDKRADIYSLGMVMYKLLNNNRDPFVDPHKPMVTYAEKNSAIERRWRGDKLPAPCNASPAMAAVILKAVEFSPENRYSDAAEFKAALMDANNSAAVQAESPVVASNYFDHTVAARDFELPTPVGTAESAESPTVFADDEATVMASEEPTVFADDEATVMEGEEPTVFADDEATVMEGEEPTVFADDEATAMAETSPVNKVPAIIKKTLNYQIADENSPKKNRVSAVAKRTVEYQVSDSSAPKTKYVAPVKSIPVPQKEDTELLQKLRSLDVKYFGVTLCLGMAIAHALSLLVFSPYNRMSISNLIAILLFGVPVCIGLFLYGASKKKPFALLSSLIICVAVSLLSYRSSLVFVVIESLVAILYLIAIWSDQKNFKPEELAQKRALPFYPRTTSIVIMVCVAASLILTAYIFITKGMPKIFAPFLVLDLLVFYLAALSMSGSVSWSKGLKVVLFFELMFKIFIVGYYNPVIVFNIPYALQCFILALIVSASVVMTAMPMFTDYNKIETD